MADRRPAPRRRGRFAVWAIAYALAIAYVSLVLGPTGFNFVPLDPDVAWRKLLATPYLITGSDQRPDWVANLLMLVPLGFVLTGGVLAPGAPPALAGRRSGALLLSLLRDRR